MSITNPGRTLGSSGQGIKRIFATALTEIKTFDAEGIGAIRREGNKTYKWVLYDEGTAALDVVAGDFVNYVAAVGYALSKVVADTADADTTTPFGAGVILATITATLTFCWIQIIGSVTLSLDPTGTPADSNALVPSATDKAMAVATASDVEHLCGHTIDDSAKLVYLSCPF